MVTRIREMDMLISKTRIRLITLFWATPKLTDWKSDVLVYTKRVGSSSIDRYI